MSGPCESSQGPSGWQLTLGGDGASTTSPPPPKETIRGQAANHFRLQDRQGLSRERPPLSGLGSHECTQRFGNEPEKAARGQDCGRRSTTGLDSAKEVSAPCLGSPVRLVRVA